LGAFYGGFVAIAPSLAADYFGGRALAAVIGAVYGGVAFGALLGSPAAGYAYDFFGSYTGAILAGAALCFVFLCDHAVHAGAVAMAGVAPRAAPSHGNASAIDSWNVQGGLITATPQAASLPSAACSRRSSNVTALRPDSVALNASTASSSLIGYQIA
jgi:MFS family permease